MGANLFHHLLRLPMDYFEKRHVGDVISRFGALSNIQDMMTKGVIEALIDGIMATVVLVMMYFYNSMLASLVLGIVILSFGIQLAFFYPNRRITEESIIAEAKESTTFLESIRTIQAIKLFSQVFVNKTKIKYVHHILNIFNSFTLLFSFFVQRFSQE